MPARAAVVVVVVARKRTARDQLNSATVLIMALFLAPSPLRGKVGMGVGCIIRHLTPALALPLTGGGDLKAIMRIAA